ncbi:hypothetical protein P43SY_001233 [Pythium insidiosum]|uniref:SET domain-containing protein n=1 Tax=Pythium insidiosum TaxID=114742 RepID=A0AAD5L992_PYTIN|nr:hypothetical protein P43SY_001233 [Pythium insidiosum]
MLLDDDELYVGYNEWAARELGVQLCTDFVYDAACPDGVGDEDTDKDVKANEDCGRERGVFIAEDIAPQTLILSIPRASLLTIEWLERRVAASHGFYSNVSLFQRLGELRRPSTSDDAIDESDDAQGLALHEDDALAVALTFETFVERERSVWHPHLRLLPTTYNNLLYFHDDELSQLDGTGLFLVAQQMRAKVRRDHARLRELLALETAFATDDGVVPPIDEWFSLEQYRWALSTIWSRFVSVELPDSATVKAMVPVFDMLNHDPLAQVAHGFNASTQAFELVAHQHWSAGAQLFINYGPLSNHKLLALYGFVLPENPYDAVEVWLPPAGSTALAEKRNQALGSLGIDSDSSAFEITLGEINEHLLLATRILELDADLEDDFDLAMSRVLKGDVVSKALEVHVISRVIYTLEQVLEMSLKEEISLCGSSAVDKLHDRRLAMARFVCTTDRRILEDQIELLKWRLLQYLPPCSAGEGDKSVQYP